MRGWEVRTLGRIIAADACSACRQAVADDAVTAALARGDEGRAAAAEALKQMLPDLVSVDFYRADISSDLGRFCQVRVCQGAVLVQAHRLQRMGAGAIARPAPTGSAISWSRCRSRATSRPVRSRMWTCLSRR